MVRKSRVEGSEESSLSIVSTRSGAVESLEHALVDASSDAIVAISPDGEILTWNAGATALLGHAATEAVKQFYPDFLVHPEDCGKALAAVREAREHGSARLALRALRRDGSSLPVDASLKAVHNADGSLRFM